MEKMLIKRHKKTIKFCKSLIMLYKLVNLAFYHCGIMCHITAQKYNYLHKGLINSTLQKCNY